jgi:hypothetical protein
MIPSQEFPKEIFLKLEGQEFLEGRLTINQLKSSFWVEVDLVQIESRKIWVHVGDLHNVSSEDEATYRSVQMLSDFLKTKNS